MAMPVIARRWPVWLDAKQLTHVRAAGGDARHDSVTLADLILDDVVEVGQGGTKGGGILLDRFTSCRRNRQWRWIVVDVVGRQKAVKVSLSASVDLGRPLAY
jgi:hypothetical protein